ncbi:bifunctional tetrahydrofolate synthase/dihydrofolate synthase [Dyella sp. A6]|uniref:bifunctional tetrahydrofolate synthase/dihydrofolate synthase n=1 Tax=Dyella aluminiiresistens TaxID=3069105 RepID=UPI002E78F3A7|nr:bifunctional tetrahydrofolate synthase/dihydrofolate synthase [Dyella sp. A6]
MTRTLSEWLAYQEHVNPRSIELGLERVRAVWQRMGHAAPARRVVTVGGTNGKGSTVALLEAMLRAAGLSVGCYTSPHLLNYNERVRIDGRDADDAALVDSFERIEAARGDTPLTYFEFGTLAALDLFARAALDVAVLEVGLGGRLDAVNIVDADVAVVTTVDLDHMDWLGPDRDSIGHEKAGIARQGRPVVVGETEPPAGLLDALATAGAVVERAGRDFFAERGTTDWRWRHRDGTVLTLPNLALAAPVQFANAATAVAVLHVTLADGQRLLAPAKLADAAPAGLREVKVAARLQALGGDPAVFVDVAHNPQAARALAAWLDTQPAMPTHAVYGALADKDVAGVIAALGDRIAHWHLAGLERDTPRGLPVAALVERLQTILPDAPYDACDDVAAALTAARAKACPGARILVFGSFFLATAVLGHVAA